MAKQRGGEAGGSLETKKAERKRIQRELCEKVESILAGDRVETRKERVWTPTDALDRTLHTHESNNIKLRTHAPVPYKDLQYLVVYEGVDNTGWLPRVETRIGMLDLDGITLQRVNNHPDLGTGYLRVTDISDAKVAFNDIATFRDEKVKVAGETARLQDLQAISQLLEIVSDSDAPRELAV